MGGRWGLSLQPDHKSSISLDNRTTGSDGDDISGDEDCGGGVAADLSVSNDLVSSVDGAAQRWIISRDPPQVLSSSSSGSGLRNSMVNQADGQAAEVGAASYLEVPHPLWWHGNSR
ncbi:hypothetical protein Tco_0155068 [Tanacetum coccineum]